MVGPPPPPSPPPPPLLLPLLSVRVGTVGTVGRVLRDVELVSCSCVGEPRLMAATRLRLALERAAGRSPARGVGEDEGGRLVEVV